MLAPLSFRVIASSFIYLICGIDFTVCRYFLFIYTYPLMQKFYFPTSGGFCPLFVFAGSVQNRIGIFLRGDIVILSGFMDADGEDPLDFAAGINLVGRGAFYEPTLIHDGDLTAVAQGVGEVVEHHDDGFAARGERGN